MDDMDEMGYLYEQFECFNHDSNCNLSGYYDCFHMEVSYNGGISNSWKVYCIENPNLKG